MFFSSPINRNLLQQIKGDHSVLSRIAALREVSRLIIEGCLLSTPVDSQSDIRISSKYNHLIQCQCIFERGHFLIAAYYLMLYLCR